MPDSEFKFTGKPPVRPGQAGKKPRKRPEPKNPDLAATKKSYGPSPTSAPKVPAGSSVFGGSASSRQAAQNKAASERQARKKAARPKRTPSPGPNTKSTGAFSTWPAPTKAQQLAYLNRIPAP